MILWKVLETVGRSGKALYLKVNTLTTPHLLFAFFVYLFVCLRTMGQGKEAFYKLNLLIPQTQK